MAQADGKPVWVFTLEVRVPEEGDGEEQARRKLAYHLDPLDWSDKGHWITIKGEWRGQRRLPALDDTEPVPGERYELVHVEDLRPGDQIYLMARRRLVMAEPYHPEEMRPELLRIPVSGAVPGEMKMAPPFERDHLVPRLLAGYAQEAR
jgi:hypothetical protein